MSDIEPVLIYAVGITTITIILLVLSLWLGKPLRNLIKQKLSPAKYSKLVKHMTDGSEYEEFVVNPREVKSADRTFQKDQQHIIAGTVIKGVFHRDGYTGVPVHHVFEGEMENRNLMSKVAPSIESKLLNQTIIGAYQAGKLDQATEMQKKDSFFTIQNILTVVLIIALIIVAGLTVQNQDLLTKIAEQTVGGASRIVAG